MDHTFMTQQNVEEKPAIKLDSIGCALQSKSLCTLGIILDISIFT